MIYKVGDVITISINIGHMTNNLTKVRILRDREFRYDYFTYVVEEITPKCFPINTKFYVFEHQIVK